MIDFLALFMLSLRIIEVGASVITGLSLLAIAYHEIHLKPTRRGPSK